MKQLTQKKIDTVVMSKMGTIHIGKSRYQAEQALSYSFFPKFNKMLLPKLQTE